MTAIAYLCVYNEADFLPWTLRHLQEQGVQAYVLDNWSTDGSDEIAQEFPLVGFERFPADGPVPKFSLIGALNRKAQLAATSGADWCMHYDTDEIRRSSRPGESLLAGFARVQKRGYNAVNFRCLHFWPVDDGYTVASNPESYFRHYTTDHEDCKIRQVKAWRNTGRPVDLVSSGGHYANFPGVQVCPEKFILKHYPFRTTEQARRKVCQERLPRYAQDGLARGWHVHYKGFTPEREWLRDPREMQQVPG